MNAAPIEILEQIIAYIPIEDLFSLCHTDRTLFKLVRHEAYKRWKQCAVKYGELFWEEQDLDKFSKELPESPELAIIYDKLNTNLDNQEAIAEEQLIIMRKMKNHSMIVDEQEKEIIDYCTNKSKYCFDFWGRYDFWELKSWRFGEWLEDDESEDGTSEESEYDTSEDSASEESEYDTSEDEW